jgi:hypothetical protein
VGGRFDLPAGALHLGPPPAPARIIFWPGRRRQVGRRLAHCLHAREPAGRDAIWSAGVLLHRWRSDSHRRRGRPLSAGRAAPREPLVAQPVRGPTTRRRRPLFAPYARPARRPPTPGRRGPACASFGWRRHGRGPDQIIPRPYRAAPRSLVVVAGRRRREIGLVRNKRMDEREQTALQIMMFEWIAQGVADKPAGRVQATQAHRNRAPLAIVIVCLCKFLLNWTKFHIVPSWTTRARLRPGLGSGLGAGPAAKIELGGGQRRRAAGATWKLACAPVGASGVFANSSVFVAAAAGRWPARKRGVPMALSRCGPAAAAGNWTVA